MSLKPQLLSWIICDGVHVDPATGKHYILGAYSYLGTAQFPVRIPRMIFFLTVAGLREGKHNLKISMGLPMEELKTVVDTDFESKGPLERITLINGLQGITFGGPGQYAITIDINDENLLVTSLPVSGPSRGPAGAPNGAPASDGPAA